MQNINSTHVSRLTKYWDQSRETLSNLFQVSSSFEWINKLKSLSNIFIGNYGLIEITDIRKGKLISADITFLFSDDDTELLREVFNHCFLTLGVNKIHFEKPVVENRYFTVNDFEYFSTLNYPEEEAIEIEPKLEPIIEPELEPELVSVKEEVETVVQEPQVIEPKLKPKKAKKKRASKKEEQKETV